MGDVGSVASVGFLVEGTGAPVLVGRAASGGVFCGVSELSVTLGSLLLISGVLFLFC